MIEESLKDLVRTFRFLFEQHGFTVVEQEDSGGLRWFAVAASKDMRIRFAGDRGDILVDVTSAGHGNEWLDLILVSSLVTGRDVAEPGTSAELARFLQDHYSTVARLLSPDLFPVTAEKVRKLGEERAQKLFPGSFG